jgi:hypothetical protein
MTANHFAAAKLFRTPDIANVALCAATSIVSNFYSSLVENKKPRQVWISSFEQNKLEVSDSTDCLVSKHAGTTIGDCRDLALCRDMSFHVL